MSETRPSQDEASDMSESNTSRLSQMINRWHARLEELQTTTIRGTIKRKRGADPDTFQGDNADSNKRVKIEGPKIEPLSPRPRRPRPKVGPRDRVNKVWKRDDLKMETVRKSAAVEHQRTQEKGAISDQLQSRQNSREASIVHNLIKKNAPRPVPKENSATNDNGQLFYADMQDLVCDVIPDIEREVEAHHRWLSTMNLAISEDIETYLALHPRYCCWSWFAVSEEAFRLKSERVEDILDMWRPIKHIIDVKMRNSVASHNTHLSICIAIMSTYTRLRCGTERAVLEQMKSIQRAGIELHRNQVKQYYHFWREKVVALQHKLAHSKYDFQAFEINSRPELMEELMASGHAKAKTAEEVSAEFEADISESDSDLLEVYHSADMVNEGPPVTRSAETSATDFDKDVWENENEFLKFYYSDVAQK